MEYMDDYQFSRSYLLPGEQSTWRGRPEKGLFLLPSDIITIPFGIFWLPLQQLFCIGEHQRSGARAKRNQRNGKMAKTLAHRRGFSSLSKNKFFDRLTEVKGAGKTSKPISSAYIGTVESGLRSKSKCLAQQGFADLVQLHRYLAF